MLLPLLAVLLSAPPAQANVVVVDRVFLAPLKAQEGTGDDARVVIENALLAAAQARNPGVIGSADLAIIMDAEAQKQVAGCDSMSCEAELADALGAPELLSGQLSRLGNTWVLSLARLRRADLVVVKRHQVSREGSSAEVLLPAIAELCDVVVGPVPGASGLAIAGGVGAGVGAATAVVGGAFLGWGFVKFNEGKEALAADDRQKAFEIRRDNEWLTPVGAVVLAVGGVVAVAGASAFAVGMIGGEP